MEQERTKKYGIWYIQNLLLAYVFTAVILLMTAFLLYKTTIPAGAVAGFVLAAYILSNLAGGFRMGKMVEKRQFIWGLLVGIGYTGILLCISFVGNGYHMGEWGRMVLITVVCTFSGMFGGMLS